MSERIRIRRGDITDMDVDAIVNAANTDLMLGAGVAGAIRRRGGGQIQKECSEHGPVPLGGAAITGGGELKARHVIHAASMQLGGSTTARSLRKSVRSSLELAAENGLASIAFPAIGCGIGAFPVEEAAQIMLEEARDHLKGKTPLEAIYFVLFDEKTFETFQKVNGDCQDGDCHDR
jgi:O-acetyl-ADP-ribose deacetylase (regulator of RNase III)